jgi:hypothetical protein
MPKKRLISIAQCRFCKHLDDHEFGFQKYGDEENETFLPKISQEITGTDPSNGYYRCPICDTFYHYRTRYDYYVNGGEDEETLRRLSPTEAKDQISPASYKARLKCFPRQLKSKNIRLKRHAAKSLFIYYALDSGELDKAVELIKSPDRDIRKGVLSYMYFLSDYYGSGKDLIQFLPVFKKAGSSRYKKTRGLLAGIKQHTGWKF